VTGRAFLLIRLDQKRRGENGTEQDEGGKQNRGEIKKRRLRFVQEMGSEKLVRNSTENLLSIRFGFMRLGGKSESVPDSVGDKTGCPSQPGSRCLHRTLRWSKEFYLIRHFSNVCEGWNGEVAGDACRKFLEGKISQKREKKEAFLMRDLVRRLTEGMGRGCEIAM